MIKIIVTGSNGQLGQEFQELAAQHNDCQFFFFSKNELNITDDTAIFSALQNIKPDYLINCAAYTAVDKAETEQELAFAINAEAVKKMAAACKQADVRFVHISTDYVFDGKGVKPYKEDDIIVNPVNVYGASKYAGEKEALNTNDASLIIRTSWVYSSFGNNFVKTMLRLFESRPEVKVVNDQYGSPTYAADLAEAILTIIQSGKWEGGVYHFSNEGDITWYDFACEIKKLTNAVCVVTPIPTEEYPTPANRPDYSVFDKSKIQQIFGIQIKDWQKSLELCISKLQKK